MQLYVLSFILTYIHTYVYCSCILYIDFVQQMSLQSDNMSISSSKDANNNRDSINSRNACNSIFGDNCNSRGSSNIWDTRESKNSTNANSNKNISNSEVERMQEQGHEQQNV